MSKQPYREPGDMSTTEIECAKIHEAGETKRKAIEEREKTRRQDLSERDGPGYILSRLAAACVLIGVIIAVGTSANAWIEAKKGPGQCAEGSYLKANYSTVECKHPLHVLVQDEKSWSCKCGKVVAP